MTAVARTADLFRPIADVDDIAAGLGLLTISRPLWPLSTERWLEVVTILTAFHGRHGRHAAALGWDPISLYGVVRRAPYNGLWGMGAACLIARAGHHVLEVDRQTMLLVSSAGSRLRIFRRLLGPESVVIWDLCGSQPSPPIGGVAAPS
jgi:hypothetical protein